jgi:hypothetical protein
MLWNQAMQVMMILPMFKCSRIHVTVIHRIHVKCN